MKNLPVITVLLWAGTLFGYWFLPGVFRLDILLFPLVVILSILLPVSFWQVANKEQGKYLSLLFIGIFIVDVFGLLFITQSNYVLQQDLSEALSKGIQTKFAEYLETAASGKRKLAAQLIYQRHGVALSYKNDTDTRTLYLPDESDKKQYRKNFFLQNDLKLRSLEIASSLFTAVVLLLMHVTLFIALLIFLILYDNGQFRNRSDS